MEKVVLHPVIQVIITIIGVQHQCLPVHKMMSHVKSVCVAK